MHMMDYMYILTVLLLTHDLYGCNLHVFGIY